MGKPSGLQGTSAQLTALFSLALAVYMTLLYLASNAEKNRCQALRHKQPGDETIFVSIGAYRDAECANTILSLFNMADKPHRVYVGAVAYIKADKFNATEMCDHRALNQYRQNVHFTVHNHTEGRGPTLARWECAESNDGQDYYMQIDSHMEFVAGWDTQLIDMLRQAPSSKAVLTAYPAAIGDNSGLIPVICKSTFNWQNIPTWEAALVRNSPGKPLRPSTIVAGGFFFTRGVAIREVPFDPDLPYLFTGEETLYSARLWTSGWDFYAPNVSLIYHHYMRKGAPKFWEDLNGPTYTSGLKQSVNKVLRLLNSTEGIPGYTYGMGSVRPLDDYWTWLHLDWQNKKSTSAAVFCK